MISLEQVAREKIRINQVFPTAEPSYDHGKQQRWNDDDFVARKIYMKSSTQFDGEKDNGGDDK
jgi:hypothetical protein